MSGQSSASVAEGGKRVNKDEAEVLLVERKGPVTFLTLNRPKVLNSLNVAMLEALNRECEKLTADRQTRVVVISGAGCKVFCAGADLTERKGMTEGQVIGYLNLIQKIMSAVESLPQPVIAAINGSAFGGGTELALACDLRIMTEEAVLRLTEVRLGIIPGAGGTQRLSRLIGKSRAKEMILTAKALAAKEALEIGLVHKLAPKAKDGEESHTQLLEAAATWAAEIASAAPLALKAAKFAIDMGSDRDLSAGLALETKAYLQLLHTRDRLEGLAAFAEKRDPVYIGE